MLLPFDRHIFRYLLERTFNNTPSSIAQGQNTLPRFPPSLRPRKVKKPQPIIKSTPLTLSLIPPSSSSTELPKPENNFHLFSSLPKELRDHIWHLALPARLVDVQIPRLPLSRRILEWEYDQVSPSTSTITSTIKPGSDRSPLALLAVNWETRELLLRHYRPSFCRLASSRKSNGKLKIHCIPMYSLPLLGEELAPGYLFNAKIDVLSVDVETLFKIVKFDIEILSELRVVAVKYSGIFVPLPGNATTISNPINGVATPYPFQMMWHGYGDIWTGISKLLKRTKRLKRLWICVSDEEEVPEGELVRFRLFKRILEKRATSKLGERLKEERDVAVGSGDDERVKRLNRKLGRWKRIVKVASLGELEAQKGLVGRGEMEKRS